MSSACFRNIPLWGIIILLLLNTMPLTWLQDQMLNLVGQCYSHFSVNDSLAPQSHFPDESLLISQLEWDPQRHILKEENSYLPCSNCGSSRCCHPGGFHRPSSITTFCCPPYLAFRISEGTEGWLHLVCPLQLSQGVHKGHCYSKDSNLAHMGCMHTYNGIHTYDNILTNHGYYK